jgi:mannose-6-phosphate isomerase-like protein (cupin superfamily)
MNIQIDPHTLERAEERGATADEIIDVITSGTPITAKYGRLGKAKTYDFKMNRLGKYHDHKRVEVFFAVEGDVIVTVTVYVFYGKWEIADGNPV